MRKKSWAPARFPSSRGSNSHCEWSGNFRELYRHRRRRGHYVVIFIILARTFIASLKSEPNDSTRKIHSWKWSSLARSNWSFAHFLMPHSATSVFIGMMIHSRRWIDAWRPPSHVVTSTLSNHLWRSRTDQHPPGPRWLTWPRAPRWSHAGFTQGHPLRYLLWAQSRCYFPDDTSRATVSPCEGPC